MEFGSILEIVHGFFKVSKMPGKGLACLKIK